MRARNVVISAALVLVWAVTSAAQPAPANWQAQIRERVAAKQIACALEIAERRLAETPQDLEARGWRARLLAWSGRWAEAEAEYRKVLESAPQDTDILVGLADVLVRQQRFEESLALLDQAQGLAPGRAELSNRRGRALRGLGRREEARKAFREALSRDPGNAEARAGLLSLEEEPRHELRIGSDFDVYNFTEEAQTLTAALRSRLNSTWTTHFTGSSHQRFGQNAGKFTASATYRINSSNSLTAGSAVGRHEGVIPRAEAFFEYAHGINLGRQGLVRGVRRQGPVRGVELGYRQHWLWFRDARVLVLTPNVLFYLPRDWTWSIAITAARSRFPGTAAEWRPAGLTRLSFPLHRRWTANVFFAVGTENFAQADEIGRFSARTFGGGVRYQFASRHEITGYVLYQDRSQRRAQVGFGFSYAVRF